MFLYGIKRNDMNENDKQIKSPNQTFLRNVKSHLKSNQEIIKTDINNIT